MYFIRSSSGAPDGEVQSSSGAHDGEASQCSSDDNMMNRRNPLERKVQREVRSLALTFVGTYWGTSSTTSGSTPYYWGPQ